MIDFFDLSLLIMDTFAVGGKVTEVV